MDKIEIIKLLLLVVWPILVIGGFIFYKKFPKIKNWIYSKYHHYHYLYNYWKTGKYKSKKDIDRYSEYFQQLLEIKTGKYKSKKDRKYDKNILEYINNVITNQLIFDSKIVNDDNIIARVDLEHCTVRKDIKDIVLNVFNYKPNNFRMRLSIYFNHNVKDTSFYINLNKHFNEHQQIELNKLNNTTGKNYDNIFVSSNYNLSTYAIDALKHSKTDPTVIYALNYSFSITKKTEKNMRENLDKYLYNIVCKYILNNLLEKDHE